MVLMELNLLALLYVQHDLGAANVYSDTLLALFQLFPNTIHQLMS